MARVSVTTYIAAMQLVLAVDSNWFLSFKGLELYQWDVHHRLLREMMINGAVQSVLNMQVC